jgi:hypothetical protein
MHSAHMLIARSLIARLTEGQVVAGDKLDTVTVDACDALAQRLVDTRGGTTGVLDVAAVAAWLVQDLSTLADVEPIDYLDRVAAGMAKPDDDLAD